jgi:ParB family chromosome partitioning protein
MAKAAKQKGLGRGLEALFADAQTRDFTTEESGGEGVEMLKTDSIKPNSTQPRKNFDEEGMADLTASIKEHGIIQPIIVRPSGAGFEIVAGERRYRAARAAGLKEVPAIVRELSDRDNMLFAIIENMQREDLNPVEEAEGLESMIKGYGLTQEEVSQSVGKSRPYITNSLRLLKLSPEIRKMISAGEISGAHGRTLLACKDEKKRLALAEKTAREDLSVRALEELVKNKAKRKKALPRKKDANVAAVEEELKKALGTKVNIVRRGKRGKIEIEYYSDDELERLIELLEGTSKE